jgi:hypothetical protein
MKPAQAGPGLMALVHGPFDTGRVKAASPFSRLFLSGFYSLTVTSNLRGNPQPCLQER